MKECSLPAGNDYTFVLLHCVTLSDYLRTCVWSAARIKFSLLLSATGII